MCDAGNELTGRRVAEQALADIAQHVAGLGAARFVRVDGFRVRDEASM